MTDLHQKYVQVCVNWYSMCVRASRQEYLIPYIQPLVVQ